MDPGSGTTPPSERLPAADLPADADRLAPSEMPDELRELFEAAHAAQANAYVPYSRFRVGAAVRSVTGRVYVGCNVENAAYPQGWCAEASALAAMVTAGERALASVLVVCEGELLATPCGGCRQKVREFATGDTRIHVCGPEGLRATYTMDQLLPDSFGPEHLAGS